MKKWNWQMIGVWLLGCTFCSMAWAGVIWYIYLLLK